MRSMLRRRAASRDACGTSDGGDGAPTAAPHAHARGRRRGAAATVAAPPANSSDAPTQSNDQDQQDGLSSVLRITKKARLVDTAADLDGWPTDQDVDQPRAHQLAQTRSITSNGRWWLVLRILAASVLMLALIAALASHPAVQRTTREALAARPELAMQLQHDAEMVAGLWAAVAWPLPRMPPHLHQQLAQLRGMLMHLAREAEAQAEPYGGGALYSLWRRLRGPPARTAQQQAKWEARWNASVVANVLPEGHHWAALGAAIAKSLRNDGPAARTKPLVLLAACDLEHPWDCLALETRLGMHSGQWPDCLFVFDARQLEVRPEVAPEAGDVAAVVAPFLRRCPNLQTMARLISTIYPVAAQGLVMIHGIRNLPLGAVLALAEAFVPSGGFRYGGFVPAANATFVLTTKFDLKPVFDTPEFNHNLPEFIYDHITRWIKTEYHTYLMDSVAERGAHPDPRVWIPAKRVLAKVLPQLWRRIDHVLPLRLSELRVVDERRGTPEQERAARQRMYGIGSLNQVPANFWGYPVRNLGD